MLLAKLLAGLRPVAAGLSLLVALRFAWVEAHALRDGLASPPSTIHRAGTRGLTQPDKSAGRGGESAAEMVGLAAQTREQMLNQFTEELQSALPLAPAAPSVLQRHIFVDFGPPRSQVFIEGKLVGQTPFGGQISCVEGRAIQVVVLPQHGAPITRSYECLTGPKPSESALPSVLLEPELGRSVSNLKPPAAQ